MLKSRLLRVESTFGDPLPSFRIYVEHYLLCCSAVRTGECVCASSGCWGPATQCCADCVGRCYFTRQAHFYRRIVLYTSDIKPVVQSCLKKSEKECLWNHFPLYLTHNWTGLISCQNKNRGDLKERSVKEWVSLHMRAVIQKGKKSFWVFSVPDQNQHAKV